MSKETTTAVQTPFGSFAIEGDPTALRQTKSLPAKPSPGQEQKNQDQASPPAKGDPAPKPAKPKQVPAVKAVQNEFLKIVRGDPPKEDVKDVEDGAKGEEGAGDPPKANAPLTEDRIAEVAATVAGKVVEGIEARRVAAAAEVAEPKEEEPDDSKLPDRYQEDEPVYEALKQLDPKKYGDIIQRISKSSREEDAYIAAWKKANPGKEFDEADEAHNAFYDRIEVKIPQADLDKAKERSVEIRAKRAAKATIDDERRRERESASAAELESEAKRQSSIEALRAIAQALPEYDLVGKTQDEQSAIMAQMSEDKAALAAINQIAPIAAERFRNVQLLFAGALKLDPKNPHHAAIVNAAKEAHKRITALPADKQIVGGRRYIPATEFNKLTAEQRAGVWTVGAAEISEVLREEIAANLTAGIKNTRKLAREIAGLPPEDDDSNAGAGSAVSRSGGASSAINSVSFAAGGRLPAASRGKRGAAAVEDAFWKSVGGS